MSYIDYLIARVKETEHLYQASMEGRSSFSDWRDRVIESRWYTSAQVAELLGRDLHVIRVTMSLGLMKAVWRRGDYRLRGSWLIEWGKNPILYTKDTDDAMPDLIPLLKEEDHTEEPMPHQDEIAGPVVYFIRDGDAVKIGYTAGIPERRRKSFTTGNPRPLTLLGFIPGDKTTEEELHDRFSDYNIHDEWFRFEGEVLAYVQEAICQTSRR